MKTIKINCGKSIPDNFSGIVVFPDGKKEWYKKGKIHRKDGPAVEYPNGTKEWFKEGNLHREDGPAIIYPNGTKYWNKEGKLHRLNGPAIEFPNGEKQWWIECKLYLPEKLLYLINSCFYLGKEKGQYGLDWLRFLTEEGIEEFPIIPGIEQYKDFKKIFNKLKG